MSSIDLELLGGLPKLSVQSTVDVSVDHGKGSGEDGPVTPKSEEHRIPAVLHCPPAPRKPRRKATGKRKLVEVEFFEVVRREEVDSFFRSCFGDEIAKRRCPCK